jgi:hypothetical protein
LPWRSLIDPHTAVPYDDLGVRPGVSRTHVGNLLMDAEQAALVRLHVRAGHRVEILPRLWASHDRGTAGSMYLHDMLYVATANAIRAAKRRRQRVRRSAAEVPGVRGAFGSPKARDGITIEQGLV